jgi:hypothetical protein
MYHYIVRVELHDANSDDYKKLHKIMLDDGFGNLVKGDDGKNYHLPSAEYHATSAELLSTEIMRDNLRRMLIPVGRSYRLLISRADQIAWVSELA